MKYVIQKTCSTSSPGFSTPCVLWGGYLTGGYGRTRWRGKVCGAHRAAWEKANGSIPPGMFVCHKCDVRNCVEPTHLFLGTQQDNLNDMVGKGRSTTGEKNPKSRFTEAQITDIRRRVVAGETQRQIAREFDTSFQYINKIVLRKQWKCVAP